MCLDHVFRVGNKNDATHYEQIKKKQTFYFQFEYLLPNSKKVLITYIYLFFIIPLVSWQNYGTYLLLSNKRAFEKNNPAPHAIFIK
jgi:hypothetical protein